MRGSRATLFPIFLDLRGVRVLLVGGGPVALRKATALQRAGAVVRVIALEFAPGWAALKGVRRERRAFKWTDLRRARLVFAATSDARLNSRIAKRAKISRAWVNCAAPPECGDFQVPAHFLHGRMQVAVSTGGASAAAARTLKLELERRLKKDALAWSSWLNLLEARRAKILRRVADPEVRRALLQELGSAKCLEMVVKRGRNAAAKQMNRWIDAAALRAGRTELVRKKTK